MAKVYLPVAAGQTGRLALRLRAGGSGDSAERLRRLAAELDPRLQLRDVRPLDELMGDGQMELSLAAWGTGIVAFSVLLQSAAGLYALMSFAVAHRRREIGIRAALGANPRRILAGIFGRAFWQLGAGVVAGSSVAFAVNSLTDGELTGEVGPILLPIVAALMMFVGLLAAIVPARRGLRIQPTEALREE
jgi:putative ABC transport system permease protein